MRETKSRMRIGGDTRQYFWTGKGVRQECPLSPFMFNLLTADMEEVMKRDVWGKIGGGKDIYVGICR